MAKKKRPPIDKGAARFSRNVSRDIEMPANAGEWRADLETAYAQGWADAVTHVTRLNRKRMKRRH